MASAPMPTMPGGGSGEALGNFLFMVFSGFCYSLFFFRFLVGFFSWSFLVFFSFGVF